MAAIISCRSVRPSTVSARVCSSIWWFFRPDAVTDGAVGNGSEFKTHDATPNVNRPARAVRHTMWVRATDGPLDTLVASSNVWDCWVSKPQLLSSWLIGAGSNIASRSQTREEQNKADQGQHEIARPLRRERVNSSAGSKISRTAQIIRLAPDRPPNDGYVQALALGACRLLRIGTWFQRPTIQLFEVGMFEKPTPPWRLRWQDRRGAPMDSHKSSPLLPDTPSRAPSAAHRRVGTPPHHRKTHGINRATREAARSNR